jgi:OOP family OmpA-OmpF porin
VTARGCPSDFDGDGVPDGLDRCADTAEGASVDAKGCARDSDGDGIPDGLDACEATLPGTAVGPSGCPIDSDGDGVSDDADDCPDTRRGIAVDRSGCPPLTGEEAALAEGSAPLILGGARFATGRADLDGEARATLARVASALLRRPEVRLEIGGHTDSTGTEESNLDLSRRRAEAVRDLLVSQGVDPARLVTEGYGASRPVADDATEEGRAKNRRVELKPIR